MIKEKGILLPIFSLPSKYGIGDFGFEAYEFIDILSENHIDYWEILPINSNNDLPYSPLSYYALEEDYVSIDKLKKMGLLVAVNQLPDSNYTHHSNFKEKYYKLAYKNFIPTPEYIEFKKTKEIVQYAKFLEDTYDQDREYNIFLQYILDKQWNELKEYANSKNVKIVGDMPIYPAFLSAEVKCNPKYYQLTNGMMDYVSGTPPDDYNTNGQKWNNPVYDFKAMEQDGFEYMINRFRSYLKRFDIIRVDHFKAFDEFYKIPIRESATSGVYEQGPKYAFFEKLLHYCSSSRLWIEDLGDIQKETRKLKEHYNFIGQNIVVQSIDLRQGIDSGSSKTNIVNYLTNHDTETIVGWYGNLNFFQKRAVRRMLILEGANKFKINKAMIKHCMKSNANVVVIQVQDILGLSNIARINMPGISSEHNWSWKLTSFDQLRKNIKYFAKL